MATNKLIRHVAYLMTPAFGSTIALRSEPALADKPLVLMDEQDRVLAVNAFAARSGIKEGQTESQAIARCPDIVLRHASRYPIFELQTALMERTAQYAGRWQPAGLGCAYLDTTGIGGNLLSWCQALASEVRHLDMIPAVGMAASKFVATAAGQAAGRDTMLLLNPIVQEAFLAAQPVTLLPLDSAAQLHLRHLGIRTLGQYARLPAPGVLLRFGKAGRTAQRWAQGRDERLVTPPDELPEISARIQFDSPVSNREILMAALMQRTAMLLASLHAQLQAVGRLVLVVARGDGRVLPAHHVFPLPTAAKETIRLALNGSLDRITWDGEGAIELALTFAQITDAPAQQLSLLDITPTPREKLTTTLDRLAARFGPDAFRMAVLTEPGHPLPERRVNWHAFR